MCRLILLCSVLATLGNDGSSGTAAPEDERDERILKQAGVSADGDSLLAFLMKRTGNDRDLLQVTQLITQLGSKEFPVREEATKKLTNLGPIALPRLHQVESSEDVEVARRAKSCIEAIERHRNVVAMVSAIRLLARHHVQGAEEVFLGYLPYGAHAAIEEEIWFAVDSLTVRRGVVPAAFVKALQDKAAARRALAGYLVARRGEPELRKSVYPLLSDADPTVRLRAAQGLLAVADKTGIPALIALLDEPFIELAWQAEELLHWAAGDDVPDQHVGAGEVGSRTTCRRAWEIWWREHGPKLDLAALLKGPTRPGLCFVTGARLDAKTRKHASLIWVCGCDGKPRWSLTQEVDEEDHRIDVQWLPGGRLLIGHGPCIVSECDLSGKELWRYEWADKISGWRSFQRLLNGNTFLAKDFQGIEVTPEGKEVMSFYYLGRPEFKLTYEPRMLEDGRLLFQRRNLGGETESLKEVEPGSAKLLKTVTLSKKLCIRGLEVLRNGHFLYCGQNQEGTINAIQEIDAAGKLVWTYSIWAARVTRLRSGNTLAACPERLVEIAPQGKIVWEALSRDNIGSSQPLLEIIRLGFDVGPPADFDIATSIPYRLKGLRSKDPRGRSMSAGLLGGLGANAAPAIPALIEAMDDEDELARNVASFSLTKIGSQAIPSLIKATKDKRVNVRVGAVWSLGGFDKDAMSAVPALIERLRDENVKVRRKAAWALWRIRPDADSAVTALVEALKDTDDPKDARDASVGEWATRCLGDLGPRAKAAVPALTEILKEKDLRLQKKAVDILGQIGPEAKPAVVALREILLDKNADLAVRQSIPAALVNIDANAEAVLRVLEKAMNDSDRIIRAEAAKALKKVGARGSPN
jgi:HEAT repeat protein